MTDPIIVCKNVAKSFHDGALHVDVLRDVNLNLMQGEQIAIVGASGSGKTTLLHLLGGLDTPNSGEILINGKNLSLLSDREKSQLRNRQLGYIYQFHHLLPEFTVLENVCMPLLIGYTKPEIAIEKARLLLKKVGLEQRELHKLAELSGGERQRTAIVRALVTDPICVLADEPTGNLDNRTAQKVYETMLELHREFNTSFVVVTHDMQLAAKMDHIYYLEDGSLVARD